MKNGRDKDRVVSRLHMTAFSFVDASINRGLTFPHPGMGAPPVRGRSISSDVGALSGEVVAPGSYFHFPYALSYPLSPSCPLDAQC
ncbi:hypothetical protein IEO21_01190 [Rhodonia placenta]|uniref:Uncharacterized protein n=1 Tax=Rhodonia placenta TaxID=104341 RepID=A0A8H7PAB1_9APHY|nr:hypothetical protein IEO21_01190 [Postia placenta]